MRKWIPAVVVAVLVAGGLFAWMQGRAASSEAAPAGPAAARPAPAGVAAARGRAVTAVAVEAVPVARVTLRDLGSFAGSLLARSNVVVSARVAGRLQSVPVGVGDSVDRGRLLAVLDGEEYEQQAEQARAELEVARANLDNARITLEVAARDLERVKALREKKISSESELDQADANERKAAAQAAVAQAQVRQKEAALAAAELHLSQTRIQAQWQDGSATRVVGERFADPGVLLRANDPILSLLDIGTLEAVVQVTEQSYPKLRQGQRAEVTVDMLAGRAFEGRVVRIAPFLRESTRQAEVRIEVPNPQSVLKPGMPVQVTLEFGRRENVAAVPAASLTTRAERRGVFVIDSDGKVARFVAVKTGVSDGGWIEVLDPVISGSVVTLGQHLLEDGAAVTVSRPAGAGGPAAADASTGGRESSGAGQRSGS